ncbi:MAG: calcium-binding protein, partial [Sulfuritalea sp.]|nr:calcium-binding protein [Sulfuritalea sp.]
PLATALANGNTDTSLTTWGDWVDGQSGDDILIGSAAKDLLSGGMGNDILIGGAGDDLLLGEAALQQAYADWSVTPLVNADATFYHYQINQGAITGGDSIGGDDALYGGAGNDWVFAGAGDDLVDGGAGDDVLFGEAGNDVILGGTGNDVINGDNGNLPESLHGNDWIDGGDGDDRIWGMAGDDILIGGKGNDTIVGGKGRDTYIFNKGDGVDEIWDDDTGAEKSILIFGEGFDPNSIKLRKGSLLLDLGDGDAIHIENFDQVNPLASPSFEAFQFADGTSLTWDELLARGFDIDGTEGDDNPLIGTGVDDRIDGKAGNDLIWGLDGNDIITGGTGTDGMNGGLGDDTYLLGAGDGQAGVDGDGNPLIETILDDGGTDTIHFAADIDEQNLVLIDNLDGSLVIDYSAPGQPLDRLLIDHGLSAAVENYKVGAGDTARTLSHTQFIGEFGNGVYSGTDAVGRRHLTGGKGNDGIFVAGGGNFVSGGRGNDTLAVYGANNTLLYSLGDGTDYVTTGGSGNVLRLGPGITAADLKLGLGSLALQVGADPNDIIHFDSFDAANALGQKPFDSIEFDDGSVLTYADLLAQGFDLTGTAGDDLISGTNVTDRISGGAGNDLLLGGAGDDRYRFNSGDGQDVIQDSQGLNSVEFGAGLTAAAMTATQSLADDGQRYLDLDFGNGDRLSILDGELGRVESFSFADGTVLNMNQVLALLPMVNLRGGDGNDTFAGFGGNDLIDGGAGNDVVTGGDGADRLYGGLGNDMLQGDAGDDLLDGGAGNDSLAGGSGIDTYRFGLGLGQDTVIDTGGEASVLELMAGTNAFTLTARQEGDDLVLAARTGSDALRLTGYYAQPDAGTNWTVKTADGVTRDMSTFLQGVGEQVSTGSQFIAQFRQRWVGGWNAWHVNNGYSIGDDGVARRSQSSMTTVGTSTTLRSETESITLNAGDFYTGDGADTFGGRYSFPGGLNSFSWPTFESNTIQSSSTTTSSVIREAVLSSRTALDAWDQPQSVNSSAPFFVPVYQQAQPVWITGRRIPFPATSATVMDFWGQPRGAWIIPGPPIPPQPTEQTVEVRKEVVDISRVYTTPISFLGGGDDVVAGFNLDGGSGNDLLAINSDGPARYSYVRGKNLPVFLYGNDGNDYLKTAGESEIGVHGKWETIMIGGRGRDWLQGGNGRTVFMLLEEDSIDTIMSRGGSSTDEVVFGPGVTAESLRVLRAGDLLWDGPAGAYDLEYGYLGPQDREFLQLLTPDGTGAIVHIAKLPNGGIGIENVSFSDGTRLTVSQLLARLDDSQTVMGSTGDDTLVLGAGNDVIDGGQGNDLLLGAAGNDTYRFGRGSGQDVIDQSSATASDVDVLRFADDVLPSDIKLFRDDQNLYLEIADSGDLVTLKSWYDDGVKSISAVEFADGTVWAAGDISVPAITGTDGADSLYGTRGHDTMNGGAGDDMLSGGAGNDTLLGGEGRDSLLGGAGDDVLSGQGGGGYANGGPGDDTYLFDRGDGFLTIDLRSVTLTSPGNAWESNLDVVRFGAGIAPEDVVASFSMTRGRLNLGIAGSGDAIELRGWQDSNSSQIARFEFADGTVWTADTIPFQFIADTVGYDLLTGTAGDDAMFGRGGNDVLSGGAGNDILFGGDGYNVLYGEAGDDFLNAGEGGYLAGGLGNDTYLFNRGGGDVTIDQYLAEGDDSGAYAGASDTDVIRFGVGVEAGEIAVSFSEATGSLTLSIAYSNDGIHIQGWQDANYRQIARFEFFDGTVWTADTMPVPVIVGTDGDDSLSGGIGDDRLDGGAGNDILAGGAGNNNLVGGEGDDTFVADASAGVDHISDSGGVDTLVLEGATLGDISLGVGSLKIMVNSTGREIHIDDFDPENPHAEGGIENFQFADGVVMTKAELIDALGFHPTGTGGDDMLSGTSLNDVIAGLAGNDTLIGGRGDDTLDGGIGDDTYVHASGDGADTIIDADGTDQLVFGADILASGVTASRTGTLITLSVSATDSVSFAETAPGLYAVEAVSFADGSTWQTADIRQRVNMGPTGIVGAGGTAIQGQTLTASNTLADEDGLGAIDYQWQSSTDGTNWTAIDGATADSFTLGAAQVGQQVRVNASYIDARGTAESVDSEATTAVAALNPDLTLTGSDGNDTLVGDAGNDTLSGGLGSDWLSGGDGDDTFLLSADGTWASGYVCRNDGSPGQPGGGETVSIVGRVKSFDAMDGGSGVDVLVGTAGNDVIVLDDAYSPSPNGLQPRLANIERIEAGDGDDVVDLTSSRFGYGDVIIDGGLGNDVLWSSVGNDTLSGGDGNDTLNGGAGADTLIGGLGNDIYVIGDTADVIVENAAEGTDTVQSSISYMLGANLENLTLTGTAPIDGTGNELNNVLTGNVAANTLTGGDGNDTLNGGAGADTLIGHLGNDTYVVDDLGDVVVESAGEGSDTVRSYLTYALGAELENLTLLGTAAIDGTGNEFNNVLTGNAAANTLTGGAGNDALNGAAGVDTLIGGIGNDTYTVDNVDDAVIEAADEGVDLVKTSVSYTLADNVENLTLTGTASVDGTGNELDNLLTGNAAANVLFGGAGNDALNGAAGADTMLGGLGSDAYTVDNVDDVVVEAADEGTDLVSASVSYVLSDNVENLTLTGSVAISATGNALDNLLTGNSIANTLTGGAGNDTLNGAGGADSLIGGEGDDIYIVDNAGDAVVENAGEGIDQVNASVTHTLASEVENLTLTGTASIGGTGNALDNVITGTTGNNTLTGNAGSDTLDGRAGTDVLVGGSGNDTYVLGRGYGSDTVRENDATAGNTDTARFLAGIAADQIWLRHVGNNLEASIIGTTDKLTVENWYLGSNYHIEQFKTADGKLLLDSQVENLVQAMAAFAPPSAGQTSLPPAYQDTLAPVIAANWQ